MNASLMSAMDRDLAWWWEDLRGASARLRGYQRHLLECRHLSPRPRATIVLTLRQCAAARRICTHSAHVIQARRCGLNTLAGIAAR
ncbi:hypothetical protein [Aeromonas bivalvium]|uniref:hypothetical protein n=1 Tax=Aeromonas bivalvium TaxID=440079 RepID=UPI0038D23010